MTATLHTTKQTADALGISAPRVKQLAVELGIGTKVGRDWVFTSEDIERLRLRNRQAGRPRATPAVPG